MTIELIAETEEQAQEMMRRLYPDSIEFRVVGQRKARPADVANVYARLKAGKKHGQFARNSN